MSEMRERVWFTKMKIFTLWPVLENLSIQGLRYLHSMNREGGACFEAVKYWVKVHTQSKLQSLSYCPSLTKSDPYHKSDVAIKSCLCRLYCPTNTMSPTQCQELLLGSYLNIDIWSLSSAELLLYILRYHEDSYNFLIIIFSFFFERWFNWNNCTFPHPPPGTLVGHSHRKFNHIWAFLFK